MAEFEDYALPCVFGHAEPGSTLENHFRRHDNVNKIGVAKNVVGYF